MLNPVVIDRKRLQVETDLGSNPNHSTSQLCGFENH